MRNHFIFFGFFRRGYLGYITYNTTVLHKPFSFTKTLASSLSTCQKQLTRKDENNITQKSLNTEVSRQNIDLRNEVSTTKASDKLDRQIDTPPKQMKSSLPTHDVQRITAESRKLERKASALFDEMYTLRGANRKAFLMAVNKYISNESLYRRGSVEFIYAGLQWMQYFGVKKDLVAYKALIQAFPVGKMIPRNVWQVEFMHYPKHQQCGIDLLEQMEVNGIIPDDEFGKLLKDRFGIAAHVTRKYARMMYWMPKFKNMNPYPVPFDLPSDPVELALLALKRMCVDLNTNYRVYKTSEIEIASDEDTFIVSAQSPLQRCIISKHQTDHPIFVEGPYPVYLRENKQYYFVLRAEPDVNTLMKDVQRQMDEENKLFEWTSFFEEEQNEELQPVLTVHHQEDSTVLSLCITGTCSKSSVISWIRCLEKDNPNLGKIPVLFKLTSPDAEIEAIGDNRPFRELQK